MISIAIALAISLPQTGQFVPASIVVIRTRDVITQRHVRKVLNKFKVDFSFSRSVAIEYVTDADPLKLMEIMDQFAPKEQFMIYIGGTGSKHLRQSDDLTPKFIQLTAEELFGRTKAPFNVHKVLRAAKLKFKSAKTLNGVSYVPRIYLATESEYKVAFEVRLEFAEVRVFAQVIGSDVVSLWDGYP